MQSPFFKIKNKKNLSGVTLIEMLTFLFIFSLIAVTFYSVWSNGAKYILLAKNRLVANALATEKMEIVRNLAFHDIAHTTGSPAGNLVQHEDVIRDGKSYHILTQIKNEDDPFDGTCLFTGDADCVAPVDYKFVRITVSWENDAYRIVNSSRFVPSGVEQPIPDSGILIVNVISDKAGGVPVPNSTVRIRNAALGFDETHSTDLSGHLFLVGLPEAFKQYEISLEKSGYESVTTFAPYPDGPYNPPVHEHTSVVAEAVNTINIFQNELASIRVRTENYLGEALPGINFSLAGGRLIGTDSVLPNDLVWSTDLDTETGSTGEKSFGNEMSPGNYTFTLDPAETNYQIIDTDPMNPASANPGGSLTITVQLADKNFASVLVKVVTAVGAENVAVEGANVKLANAGLGYEADENSSWNGKVFFPKNPDVNPLIGGAYDLTVTASGYIQNDSQVTVVDGQLISVDVILVPVL